MTKVESSELAREARREELRKLIAEQLEIHTKPHANLGNAELLHKYERELAELDGIPFSD